MEKNVSENIKIILNVVRRTTKGIKIFPFLYAIVLLIIFPIVSFNEVNMVTQINDFFFISPFVVIFLIYLSYCVKLCKWHRIQCCLPLLPQITIFIDENIYEFGSEIALIDFITIAIIFLLSLINAYFVFIRPTRS